MQRISVKDARQAAAIGHNALVQGWVRTRRDSKGGFSFLEVNDGSCLANLQVIADAQLPNYESEAKHLVAGCNFGREAAVAALRAHGFRTVIQGVAMHRPNVAGYSRPDVFALDDWR